MNSGYSPRAWDTTRSQKPPLYVLLPLRSGSVKLINGIRMKVLIKGHRDLLILTI